MRSIREIEILLMGILDVHRDIAPAIAEIGTGQPADIIGVGVAVFADAVLGAQLKALVIVLENAIDDAGDRVRPVDSGTAPGHEIATPARTTERRGGEEGVSTGKYRW